MVDRDKSLTRCSWCHGHEIYVSYHDEEWGVPLRDDRRLFEFLILEGAQAGLSWLTILNKRENYRRAFAGFDPEKIARFNRRSRERLLADAGIVRNRLKIDAAINNATACLRLRDEGLSLSDYLWDFVDGTPIQNAWRSRAEVPATSAVSDALSADLRRRGFKFVGSTICYALMQATGMVNDHLVSCHRYEACRLAG